MTAEDYLLADEDLATCFTFQNDDECQEELRQLVCEPKRREVEEDSNKDKESEKDDHLETSVKSLEEAIGVACYLLGFLTENGSLNEDIANKMLKVLLGLEAAKLQQDFSKKQSSITMYFTH